MGRMQIVLSNNLDRSFRAEVANRLGMKKGNMSRAIAEAIKLWIKTGDTKGGEWALKLGTIKKTKP